MFTNAVNCDGKHFNNKAPDQQTVCQNVIKPVTNGINCDQSNVGSVQTAITSGTHESKFAGDNNSKERKDVMYKSSLKFATLSC